MSQFIEKLKDEHVQILKVLDDIKETLITSDRSKEMLKNVKTLLLQHISEEDANLYPVLHREAKNNAHLQYILNIFEEDINKLFYEINDFYEKIEQNANSMELAKLFVTIFIKLKIRIRREESMLYIEYDQIMSR